MPYPHQPGSPSFDGADAYEAHLDEQERKMPDLSVQPDQIEGFTCNGVSDGEALCTGCWDKTGDPHAANDIPKGQPIYWKLASYEYDEWDRYCGACAQEFYRDLTESSER